MGTRKCMNELSSSSGVITLSTIIFVKNLSSHQFLEGSIDHNLSLLVLRKNCESLIIYVLVTKRQSNKA